MTTKPKRTQFARQAYIGKRTWQRVLDLSLAKGVSPYLMLGRLVKEGLDNTQVSHETEAR